MRPSKASGFSNWRRCRLVLAFSVMALKAAAETPKAPQIASTGLPAQEVVGLPDLVVVNPEEKTQQGWPFTQVSFTVRNVGGADSTKSTILRSHCITETGTTPRCGDATTAWDPLHTAMQHTSDVSVPPLHRRESVVTSAGYYNNEVGVYRMRFIVVVDPGNLVAESNELNNTA